MHGVEESSSELPLWSVGLRFRGLGGEGECRACAPLSGVAALLPTNRHQAET